MGQSPEPPPPPPPPPLRDLTCDEYTLLYFGRIEQPVTEIKGQEEEEEEEEEVEGAAPKRSHS